MGLAETERKRISGVETESLRTHQEHPNYPYFYLAVPIHDINSRPSLERIFNERLAFHQNPDEFICDGASNYYVVPGINNGLPYTPTKEELFKDQGVQFNKRSMLRIVLDPAKEAEITGQLQPGMAMVVFCREVYQVGKDPDPIRRAHNRLVFLEKPSFLQVRAIITSPEDKADMQKVVYDRNRGKNFGDPNLVVGFDGWKEYAYPTAPPAVSL